MKQISNSNTTANTWATATPPIMFTGKTAATGLAIAPVIFRPWPITATKITMGIRKMTPPIIVVLMSFSMNSVVPLFTPPSWQASGAMSGNSSC